MSQRQFEETEMWSLTANEGLFILMSELTEHKKVPVPLQTAALRNPTAHPDSCSLIYKIRANVHGLHCRVIGTMLTGLQKQRLRHED